MSADVDLTLRPDPGLRVYVGEGLTYLFTRDASGSLQVFDDDSGCSVPVEVLEHDQFVLALEMALRSRVFLRKVISRRDEQLKRAIEMESARQDGRHQGPLTTPRDIKQAAWNLALFAGDPSITSHEQCDGTPVDLHAAARVMATGANALERALMLRDSARETCERRTRERDEARAQVARLTRVAATGDALLDLVAEIRRLRDMVSRGTPGIPFAVDPASILAHTRSELEELEAESPGSEAAQSEAWDTFALALHLALEHGGQPLPGITAVTTKIRERLDAVAAGGTWDGAKAEQA